MDMILKQSQRDLKKCFDERKQSMKVLVIGLSDNPGGIESFIKSYYSMLYKDISFDFMVFTQTCVDYDWYKNHNSSIFFIKHAQFKEPLSYRKEIRDFFKLHACDYDAIWFNCCDLANIAVIMKYAKKSNIKKRIIHAHNNKLMQEGKRYYFYKMIHLFNKHKIKKFATDFWACSELAGKFFYTSSVRKTSNYHIIKNAIYTEKFKYNTETRKAYRKKLNLEHKIVIGHVGRFHFQKNHDFLIDIFNQLHKENDKYHLLLVGQGEEKENIEKKVNDLSLERNVTFLGVRNDVADLMQAMDIFLFPSVFEGLGIVLIEAQTSGLKCFTSKKVVPCDVDITGLVEFIDLKETAEQWATKIIATHLNENRDDAFQLIIQNGYDIGEASQNMKKLFLCNE